MPRKAVWCLPGCQASRYKGYVPCDREPRPASLSLPGRQTTPGEATHPEGRTSAGQGQASLELRAHCGHCSWVPTPLQGTVGDIRPDWTKRSPHQGSLASRDPAQGLTIQQSRPHNSGLTGSTHTVPQKLLVGWSPAVASKGWARAPALRSSRRQGPPCRPGQSRWRSGLAPCCSQQLWLLPQSLPAL